VATPEKRAPKSCSRVARQRPRKHIPLLAGAVSVIALGGLALGAQIARGAASPDAAAVPVATAVATGSTTGTTESTTGTTQAMPTTRPATPGAAASLERKPATTRPTHVVPAACLRYTGNQRVACGLLPSFGFSYSQMAPLAKLWTGESNWRTTASNPGSGAYGIPQALPGSKMASAGSDWRTNPRTQVRWGLDYIKQTYGTPAQAWSLWVSRSPHWY
jgi:hypothetical protein